MEKRQKFRTRKQHWIRYMIQAAFLSIIIMGFFVLLPATASYIGFQIQQDMNINLGGQTYDVTRTGVSHRPTRYYFEFTVDGRVYTMSSPRRAFEELRRPFMVYYSPDNPNISYIATNFTIFNEMFFIPSSLAVVILFLWPYTVMRNEYDLIKKGRVVYAEIEKIRWVDQRERTKEVYEKVYKRKMTKEIKWLGSFDLSSENKRGIYIVSCKWTNPEDNSNYYFTSNRFAYNYVLMYDPTPVVDPTKLDWEVTENYSSIRPLISTLPVYIDRNNPEKYHVDIEPIVEQLKSYYS